jgi:Sigma-70, region 4
MRGTGFHRIAPSKERRNLAIVGAKRQGLSLAEVGRMFGVSESRVQQICQRAALLDRFACERGEGGWPLNPGPQNRVAAGQSRA